ncbi:CPBP family intramembrane glutamic endopeptidase [Dactylosporangium sp. NPDC048998]|uniref:CPBP family intramembrane glutamic endopeptidase n=1 Tax=Dactylosporangium sp. NPDC048998 TaxID=3363976 RepID=UPI00371FB17A
MTQNDFLITPSAPDAGSITVEAGKRRRGPRPVPPGVEYHRVLAGDKRHIGRGVLALVLVLFGLFGFGGIIGYAGGQIDLHVFGRHNIIAGGTEYTPIMQLGNLVSIALLIPWSMCIQRWLYGVKGASLHSVLSKLRRARIGRAVIILLPVWAVYMTVFTALSPYKVTDWAASDLFWLFVITLVLQPLQAAGEEYGFRGLAFRVAASWGRGPRTALMIGITVSTILFAIIHGSTDIWLNIYYVTLGITWSLITWRTGGLETSIVIHAVNNTLAFLLMLVMHSDPVSGGDRSSGVGSIIFLMPCVLMAIITTMIWFRTRRTGPARTPGLEPSVLAVYAPKAQ